jgi:hypothetical protein
MDWNLAIERNHSALKRIVAALVAMAGGLSSPLAGFEARSSGRASGSTVGREGRGDCEAIGVPGTMREASGRDAENTPTRRSGDRQPPHKGEVEWAFTLPRRLHRAILRLLRPAESAVRRLIIVMARGVTLPPPRPRKRTPPSIFLRKPGGTGIYLPPGVRLSVSPAQDRGRSALPLLDPLRRPLSLSKGRRRHQAQTSIPRISFPGVTAPSPITPRLPPAPDDPLDATRLALRLQALGAALDDLPGQARRFARWKARKQAGATRRSWPLRPGRAPGQRPANRRRHEVHEVLSDLHWLAFEVLEHRDTS